VMKCSTGGRVLCLEDSSRAILMTLGRKLSLGELHQKGAVRRGFCSGIEGNHQNLDGVGRSQDLPDAH